MGNKLLGRLLLASLIIILAGIILNGKLTGLVVLEKKPAIEDVPLLAIPQGQNFTYQLQVNGGTGNLVFSDNSESIRVDQAGFVYFSTSEKNKGLYTVAVVVEDELANYDFKLIQFEIK